MKRLNYLVNLVTAVLFFTGTASVRAEICPIATYNQTTGGVTLPCVKAGSQQLSLQLDRVHPDKADGYFWALNPNFNLSTCDAVGGGCATFNENLDLTGPVAGVLAGVRHAVTLKLVNDLLSNNFYWQLADSHPIDQNNTVVLTQGVPNPKGDFESLYSLVGNFANNFDKVHDVMQLGEGVMLPAAKLKAGDEITLRIFHFNDLHNELRTVSKSKGDTHEFSQMVKIVKDARAKAAPNEIILFVSAGDDHIGNPFDELLGYDVNTFQTDAAYTAYSAAGLDASVIGNHELDRGSALLAKEIETDARFPVLSANLYGSKNLTA